MKKTRDDKVDEIFKHCEKIDANRMTIVYLLVRMNDKELSKFHLKFLSMVSVYEFDK